MTTVDDLDVDKRIIAAARSCNTIYPPSDVLIPPSSKYICKHSQVLYHSMSIKLLDMMKVKFKITITNA